MSHPASLLRCSLRRQPRLASVDARRIPKQRGARRFVRLPAMTILCLQRSSCRPLACILYPRRRSTASSLLDTSSCYLILRNLSPALSHKAPFPSFSPSDTFPLISDTLLPLDPFLFFFILRRLFPLHTAYLLPVFFALLFSA